MKVWGDISKTMIWVSIISTLFLYYVCFIKCNASFLCILENLCGFIKCNFSFIYISEYPHELHHLDKDSSKIIDSAYLHKTNLDNCPKFTQQNELYHPLPQFKVVLGTGIVSQPTSLVFCCSIDEKLHQFQHSISIQLQKMILKNIFLSWWRISSLVKLLYVYLFFILIYWLQVTLFLYVYLFLCIYPFIHCMWRCYLYDYLLLSIHGFIHCR